MAVQTKLYTVEDLWTLPTTDDYAGQKFELDEGVLVEMSPPGGKHGVLAVWLSHLLLTYVLEHDLGEVITESGFVLSKNPDIVRPPDVAFIAKSRLSTVPNEYFQLAPDLAIEIVSPNDSARDTRRKVAQYLAAGTRLVWVVYLGEHLIDVYTPGRTSEIFRGEDVLTGGDVLPGFKLSIQDIFKRLRAEEQEKGK